MEIMQPQPQRQIKFPVAAIFALLVAMLHLLYRLIFVTTYTYGAPPITLIFQFLPDLMYILLAVALFARHSKGFLVTVLSLLTFFSALDLISYVNELFRIGMYRAPALLLNVVTYFLDLGIKAILLVLAIVAFKKETNSAKACGKLWFFPGILSILSMFFSLAMTLFGRVGAMNGALAIPSILILLLNVPFCFLLAWWLTHPYKAVAPQYAAAPTGFVQAAGAVAVPTPQKVFCTGCGKELLPDEKFCAACGKQRPELSPQVAYQAPVDPEDVPSGGMNALAFFFPMIGLILYLVWKDQTPKKAKGVGKSALIGFIIWMGLSILLTILSALIPMLILFG